MVREGASNHGLALGPREGFSGGARPKGKGDMRYEDHA